MALKTLTKMPYLAMSSAMPMTSLKGNISKIQNSQVRGYICRRAQYEESCKKNFTPKTKLKRLGKEAPKPLSTEQSSEKTNTAKSSYDDCTEPQYPKEPIPEECCGTCLDAYPRFDEIYCNMANKLNKIYQKTWSDCPVLPRQPKIICCFDKIKETQLPKRERSDIPATACPLTGRLQIEPKKCQRLPYLKCANQRIPPSCFHAPGPSNCRKKRSPFPSFSECSLKKFGPRPPAECTCLAVPTMCEVWRYYKRKQTYRKTGKC